MRIYSLSRALILPLLLLVVGVGYLYYYVDKQYSIWIWLPVILAVVIYTFHGVLDHWWREKYPLKMDEKLREWLNKYFGPYVTMTEWEKNRFDQRLQLYMHGRLFQAMGKEVEGVPDDIKAMIAAHGVWMCLYKKDYLIGDMDRIVLYKHPFPTPYYQKLHNVETHHEDGVIILSLEQQVNALYHPDQYYNIAYHAYAESLVRLHPSWFTLIPDTTAKLKEITGLDPLTIETQVGMPITDWRVVHIAAYFTLPEKYKAIDEQGYQRWDAIFKKVE
jgi:hypothetical protein